jgi:hypothetical protein
MLLLSTGGFKGIVQQDGGSCIAWWCGGFLHSQQANLAGPKQLLGVQIECSSAYAAMYGCLPLRCWLHRQWRRFHVCAQHHKQTQ